MNNVTKVTTKIVVEGVKAVGLSAGIAVLFGLSTGEIKSLSNLSLDKLLK